ncbi:cation:proton antiporter [Mumia sp. ZJ430]|uniref:cation:proton antiporter domain-containing protein n=1 Tax=Mumia sp. ZJ430 TaxID=2708083 RepID=UPI0014219730|nr:cation:proton antiporter [Mumia sp. ZJ430]
MEVLSLTVALVTIFGWCVLASRLERAGLTAPIVFVAAGFVFTEVAGLFDLQLEPELVKSIAEVTLVWILFSDASKVRLMQFERDLGTYVRLLGVGLPLTVALGTVVAITVLGFEPWAALLLGAALAPTDAALGASVMSNPRVPGPIRGALNVESGLNDGIATPIVLVAIAGVASDEGIAGVDSPGRAVLALVVGVVAGVVIGWLGGAVIKEARRRRWLSEELAGPAGLALALLAYTGALVVDGNGFVAAFVGGLVFGNVAGRGGDKEVYFVEQTGALASMICWLVFGALAVPMIGDHLSWSIVLYVALSLTLVRMLPVALALLGAGFGRYGVFFIGWFGPRGLASVVFALLALEGLHDDAGSDVVAVIALAVLVSVVVHGITAVPLANRFPATPKPAGDREEAP